MKDIGKVLQPGRKKLGRLPERYAQSRLQEGRKDRRTMIITIELDQEWKTVGQLSDYLQSLSDVIRRIGGDFPDAPRGWYFHIEDLQDGDHKIEISHL